MSSWAPAAGAVISSVPRLVWGDRGAAWTRRGLPRTCDRESGRGSVSAFRPVGTAAMR